MRRSKHQKKLDNIQADYLATLNKPSEYNPFSAQKNANTCLKILRSQLDPMRDRKLTNDRTKNPLLKESNKRFKTYSLS